MKNGQAQQIKWNLWSGVLFGIGLIAFIDEAVFHQILHWHHFYDQSTSEIGLISDGFFHGFSWFATIGGLFLYSNLRRKNSLSKEIWIGGVLIGAGGFQLYDGTIQHKVMGIHQIRYVEEIMIYDIIWNSSAIIMIMIGILFIMKGRKNLLSRKELHHGPV